MMAIEGRPIGPGAGWAGVIRPDRLVRIMLAIYLIPALLAVLAVGGVGLLVQATARAVASALRGREVRPRNPLGPAPS
jgi:hypothetical protein